MKYRYEFKQHLGDFFLYENGVYTYIKVIEDASRSIEAEALLECVYKELLYEHNGVSDIDEGFCSTPEERLEVKMALSTAWAERAVHSPKAPEFSNEHILLQVLESQKLGQPTPELLRLYGRLIERIISKPNFRYHELTEEYKATAMTYLLRSGLKFNTEKSQNPFAYFSQIIYGAMLKAHTDERRKREAQSSQGKQRLEDRLRLQLRRFDQLLADASWVRPELHRPEGRTAGDSWQEAPREQDPSQGLES